MTDKKVLVEFLESELQRWLQKKLPSSLEVSLKGKHKVDINDKTTTLRGETIPVWPWGMEVSFYIDEVEKAYIEKDSSKIEQKFSAMRVKFAMDARDCSGHSELKSAGLLERAGSDTILGGWSVTFWAAMVPSEEDLKMEAVK